MTSKERVYAAMNFQPVDRVPVVILDGSSWVIKRENVSFAQQRALPDAGAAMIVKAFNDLNADVITSGSGYGMGWVNAFGGGIIDDKIGDPVRTVPFIKNEETDIPELSDDEIREKLLANTYVQSVLLQNREVKKLVGDEKMITSFITAPYTTAAVLVTISNFMRLVGKKSPYLPKLIDFACQVTDIMSDLLVESGADYITLADPVSSGDMVSPRAYAKTGFPALENMLSRRKHPAQTLVHICGKAGDRVNLLRDSVVNAFSVDSMVNMEECLANADHKICMMGNLNPTDMMMNGTPETVKAETLRLLELAAENGGGLMIGTGCDLPAGSPIENVLAMSDACIEFANR